MDDIDVLDCAKTGRRRVGGIHRALPSLARGHARVQLFVEGEDVEVAAAKAAELGASIVMPRQLLPDGDEMAITHDRFGIIFSLWRKA
jgi:predicted enzyme related to lactoylglutathione lyase